MVIFMEEFLLYIEELIIKTFGQHYYFYIIGLVLIIVGVIMLISFAYQSKKNAMEKLIDLSHNIYHLKFIDDTFTYFTTSDLSTNQMVNNDEFITLFDEDTQKLIKEWLSDISSKKRIKNTLEFIHYSKKFNQYLNIVLEVKKNNQETNEIYIDLSFIPIFSKNSPTSPFIKEHYQLEKLFFLQDKSNNILTGLISFHIKEEPSQIGKYRLDQATHQLIICKLLNHCDKDHLISKLQNGNIAFTIFNYDERKDTFLSEIQKEIEVFYEVNSMPYETFNITYTISRMKDLHYKYSLYKLEELSQRLILNKLYNTKLISLSKGEHIQNLEYIEYSEQIKHILKKKSFSFIYKPIINTKNSHIVAYHLDVIPENQILSTFDSFTKYLSNTKDIQNYFRIIIENVVQTFKDETLEKRKIKKEVIIDITPEMIKVIPTIQDDIMINQDITFTFSLDNARFETYVERYPEIYDDIALIKNGLVKNISFNYDISKITHINQKIYDSMNMFSFSIKLFNDSVKNPKLTAKFNIMLDILKENAKNIPLCINNVNDWVGYETLLLYNMKYCSGPILEIENNNMQAIINKRLSSKIKNIYKKYFGQNK